MKIICTKEELVSMLGACVLNNDSRLHDLDTGDDPCECCPLLLFCEGDYQNELLKLVEVKRK